MKAAYLRDAVAWVTWLAGLEERMHKGTDKHYTEWHAAEELTRQREKQELFAGLAYENISASGANAGELLQVCAYRSTLSPSDSATALLGFGGQCRSLIPIHTLLER